MNSNQFIFIGIGGYVAALDRGSGLEIWRTKVKGSQFVNVALEGNQLLATASGEIFCLDKSSGAIVWHNKLKGLGMGLVTVAGASPLPAMAELTRQQAAAAANSTGAT